MTQVPLGRPLAELAAAQMLRPGVARPAGFDVGPQPHFSEQLPLRRFERGETAPMNWTGSVLHQRSEMANGAVAFVAGETVNWKLAVVLEHQPVARHLRQNARRGD